ncbi:MAG: DUF1800 domain-containing protein [Phycisphaeraceae bacterium]
MDTSLSPIPDDRFGPAEARHLLVRTAFGPDRHRARALVGLGVQGAVASVLAGGDDSGLPGPPGGPDIRRPFTEEERRAYRQALGSDDPALRERARASRQQIDRDDRQMHKDLQTWWLGRMIETASPMREFQTLLWHGHFATAYQPVQDAWLLYQQNEMFRRYGLESFATLARGIVRDPAMIKYLNNHQNRKGEPNENLARELMELFTLGEGQYREGDIREGARALTGFTYDDNAFSFNQTRHDDGKKSILGRTGRFDGDDFVEILLRHPACARYIALKLYRHYVADVSDRFGDLPAAQKSVVDQIAKRLRADKYELGPTLGVLLSSRHFYDAEIVGKKIKSPAQLVVGTARSLGTPERSTSRLHENMRMMGQSLFDPPSVAGWGVGRSWINTSTLFARQNTCVYMITGKNPGRRWDRGATNYDPMSLVADLDAAKPAEVSRVLMNDLLGAHVAEDRRAPLEAFLNEGGGPVTGDRLMGFLTLVTAMPEYQLC